MENDPSYEEDNDASTFEETDPALEETDPALPSPLRLSPPGASGNGAERRWQDEEEMEEMAEVESDPDMMMMVPSRLSPSPRAYRNLNTNANTRGDAQAYVELNELMGTTWQETGRWVGYEENFDVGKGSWGPSHISYLTFKSMIQLRKAMETGVTLLDLEATSLSAVAEKVVDELVSSGGIQTSDRDGLLRVLLQRRSQSDLPAAPAIAGPSGDIEMQTFSVTQQRETIDSVEASVVLSGVLETLDKPAVAFVRLKDSTVMGSVLEAPVPVRFVFILVGPTTSGLDFSECGRAMGALMADWVFSLEAYLAQSDKEITNAIADFMDCSIVIPPTEIQDQAMLRPVIDFQQKMLRQRLRQPDTRLTIGGVKEDVSAEPREDPLVRTGVPFGGMIRDLQRRYRYMVSDYTDALNTQVMAAVIFIYFAALSPAITFGGLLADKTGNMMGVSELMIGTCVQGVIFCLIAAQPVLVIGFSGPLLVFEETFYKMCNDNGLEYIVARIWVGMWLCIIVTIVMAFEGSFLVRYISRFTQEIFSILISLIFIFETFKKLGKIFQDHPLQLNYETLNISDGKFFPAKGKTVLFNLTDANGTVTGTDLKYENVAFANTALISMCMMFACFSIAYLLRIFKRGQYLPDGLRAMIGDFGVPIAIFSMVGVGLITGETYSQKLVVPKGLIVSNPAARGWFINPMGEAKTFPVWMMFASALPALLVFILIFLESQITTLIVSKPEKKMIKGSGFHVDLFFIVFMGGIASLFGVPWLSAATVRSVSHANALTVMNTKGPGVDKVLEQRISGLLVAILVGVSILMEPILKLIPMSALFGIFLYMGVTSLSGIQMWDRFLLFFVPVKYHPKDAYASKVKTMRMHLYTVVQFVVLALLWAIKSSPAALALPFGIILTVPLRMFMTGKLFTNNEMKCLDGDEANPVLDEEPEATPA